MKLRCIILINSLDKNSWTVLFGIVDGLLSRTEQNILLYNEFFKKGLIFITDRALAHNVYSPYGKEYRSASDFERIIPDLHNSELEIVIIHELKDNLSDFLNFIPFVELLENYEGKIALGTDISSLDQRQRDTYYFSMSQFLQNFLNRKLNNGSDALYVIEEKSKTRKLGTYKNVRHSISRVFSPLIKIESYSTLFFTGISSKTSASTKNKEEIFINEYFGKVEEENPWITTYLNEISFPNVFGKYFTCFVLQYLNSEKLFEENKNIQNLIYFLNAYTVIIKELVENIIFHTKGKHGYLYFRFNKYERLVQNEKYHTYLQQSNREKRYFELKLYDFNNEGILDTFLEADNDMSIEDIFDLESYNSTRISHLDYRHVAHLGLKSFTKRLLKKKGFFSVETNDNKHKIEVTQFYRENRKKFLNKKNLKPPFLNGTHYDIILPFDFDLDNTEPNYDEFISVQLDSLKSVYIDWLKKEAANLKIEAINIDEILSANGVIDQTTTSKESQLKFVNDITERILQFEIISSGTIAFNYQNLSLLKDKNLLIKVLARIQLNSDIKLSRIIISNVDNSLIEEFKDDFKEFFVNQNQKIWSSDTALILITKNIIPYIINGENGEELNQLNRAVRTFYPKKNDDFLSLSEKSLKSKLNVFLQPYEVLIHQQKSSLFEKYVSRILDNDIEGSKIGYRLNTPFTRVGSRIISKNYYEAETLFQNSFFTDRFAYLICSSLSKIKSDKPIILLGYRRYSELLLDTIFEFSKKSGIIKVGGVVIGLDLDKERWVIQNFVNPNNPSSIDFQKFNYVIITPISSTLQTNDKLFSKFISFLKNSRRQEKFDNLNLIASYVPILVRHKSNPPESYGKLYPIESKMGWKTVSNRIISTSYSHAKEVEYFVEKEGEWYLQINKEVSFPIDFKEEKPISLTDKSSLNSRKLFGWPKVLNISDSDFEEELYRLEELKPFTYFGHLSKHRQHFQYYFDTETFVRNNASSMRICSWLEGKRNELFTNDFNNSLHVLISPAKNFESFFISLINEIVFQNQAHIIFIDVNNDARTNIEKKFSFLREVDEGLHIKIHYADHVVSTGDSITKTKSYLNTILGRQIIFYSVITIINRLSFDRNKEFNGHYKDGEWKEIKIIHSYLNLFIPPIKDSESDCGICKAKNHYEKNVLPNSSLDSCRKFILQKVEDLKVCSFDDTYPKISQRNFHRLVLTHKIYFRLSQCFQEGMNNEQIMDEIYRLYHLEGFDVFRKATFILVISSYPLNNYLQIKNFAFKLILDELAALFEDLENARYDIDLGYFFITMLSQLSVLGSNALLRKKVIICSWKFMINFVSSVDVQNRYLKTKEVISQHQIKIDYDKTEENLEIERDVLRSLLDKLGFQSREEKSQITNEKLIENFSSLYFFLTKNLTFDDENKSLWLGELLRSGKEIKDPENFEISLNNPKNELYEVGEDAIWKSNTEDFTDHYRKFLQGLFLDDTTITRKTLSNFVKEVAYNQGLRKEFFYRNKLRRFDSLNYNSLRKGFRSIIEDEYYYNNIFKYISQRKDIDLLNHLIDLTYLKLFLKSKKVEHYTSATAEQPTNIFDIILEVLTKTLSAEKSFMTINDNENGQCYTISSHGIEDKATANSLKFLQKSYFSRTIISSWNPNNIPIIIQDELDGYYEKSQLGAEKAIVFPITSNKNQKVLSTLVFLSSENVDKNKFSASMLETGRLLLLIKNDLSQLIETSFNNNILNDWINKMRSDHMLDKIYIDSDHIANQSVQKYFGKLEEMTSLLKTSEAGKGFIETIANIYYVFSNVVITTLYTNIVKNDGELDQNALQFKKNCRLDEILNDDFKTILVTLTKKFRGSEDSTSNIAFQIADKIEGISIRYNKYYLQTFIIQSLHNAFKKHLPGGHKKVNIELTPEFICISNSFPKEYIDNGTVEYNRADFGTNKEPQIKKLDCNEYSSTTLTSIQSYNNFIGHDFEFGYYGEQDNPRFKIKINFKNQ
ncbi:hypothetical protein V1387_10420 [Allomuricauda taeanensis]|uniref:hypothetical protein n=1 Tax=Flagellimonas taeanensis TaxID=1005926 RepID=UPI002E7AE8AA|nr:hypothetical protein [Allomuricauda taeanensis]MEE1963098.1 hypothetical protein [Allomuricauda taeanensis]